MGKLDALVGINVNIAEGLRQQSAGESHVHFNRQTRRQTELGRRRSDEAPPVDRLSSELRQENASRATASSCFSDSRIHSPKRFSRRRSRSRVCFFTSL